MAKELIGLRVSNKLKKLIQDGARDENRSISNFIKHCILTYLKEKKGIDHKEED